LLAKIKTAIPFLFQRPPDEEFVMRRVAVTLLAVFAIVGTSYGADQDAAKTSTKTTSYVVGMTGVT